MTPGPTATKRTVLEQLLEQGMVLAALDARVDGVDVPSHLGKDPQLRLNLSYRFGLPMAVDEWGVSATLTFAGVPYNCRFPWNAIFLMVSHVSGQPYLFPDDIPAELLSQAPEMAAGVHPVAPITNKAPAAPARPKLSLVSSPEPETSGHVPEASTLADPQATPDLAQEHPTTALDTASPAPAPATADGDATTDADAPSPPRPSRRRGHLRLVK